jgi:hypothetical protein
MKEPRSEAPSIVRIADGLFAQVVERTGIPPHLNSASHEGRTAACRCRPLVEAMTVTRRYPVRVLGVRADCRDQHDYRTSLEGTYDGKDLRLATCIYCGAVEVRDISFDILPGIKAGRGGPRRRSEVMGW